ncbi:MAG: Hsp20 family protein, partial [Dehalococcoidia bacterium]|nr:Hsp20 family protein [Dehalococcoidia bacterium]
LGEVTVPALEVYQTPDEVVVKATLAGVKPEDVAIDITGETLTIKGGTKAKGGKEEGLPVPGETLWFLFPQCGPSRRP